MAYELNESSIKKEGNTLFLPAELPDNIFMMLTFRIGSKLKLNIRPIIDEIVLNQENKLNRLDAASYIRKATSLEGIKEFIILNKITDVQFLDALLEKSHRNFMYLKHVIPEINKGHYKTLNVNLLPTGLQSYYEDHWNRMKTRDEESWFKIELPIISLLAIIKTPISTKIMSTITNLELHLVRRTIDHWLEFLFKDYYEEQLPVYRLYHQAFSDFLTRKDEVGEEIDLRDMRSKYIKFLMEWK